MDQYAISSYELQFSADYSELRVIDKSTAAVEETYDLSSQAYAVSVTDGVYGIEAGSLSGLYVTGINKNELPMSFQGPNLTGIGTTDIRDMGRAEWEVTFFMEICPATLKYESGIQKNLRVGSPCDQSTDCTEPNAACSQITEVS